MKDFTSSYKYNCRECPIRQRCINEKNLAPSIKLAIARKFDNRMDTFETWDVLHEDCLLIRAERQRAAPLKAPEETSLLRRLRQAQQVDEPPAVEPQPPAPQIKRRPAAPAPLTPAPAVPSPPAEPCGITITVTQRLVRLPDAGEIVMGRFEHGFSNPPDVDLAFDDGEIPSVSRRHALVTGRHGRHWIEDMGSTNGTYLNGRKLSLGESAQLAQGDRILLGRCRLTYTPLPKWALEPDPRVPHASILAITHTGHHLELPHKSDIMVGRPDPTVGYTPDVDLSVAGEIALYVSRRHARLIARGGRHLLEEVGSAGGTRVNGKWIRVGDPPVLLYPGDQLWLGGCVVAYEWRLH
jgi:pSer/pThr/pTyr-binding forkhead associated (FHA) protein